ncbi:hypothetical protein VPHF86_0098 [Vibrio phage F86]
MQPQTLNNDNDIMDIVSAMSVREVAEMLSKQAETEEERTAIQEMAAAHRQHEIEKEANRRVRKNKREIARLRKHAEACLFSENKEGYIYAIGKLREFTGNPVSRDVLETLWETSHEQVVKIATSFAEAKANLPEGQNFSQ